MSANRLNVLVTLMLAVALLVTDSGNGQVESYRQFNTKRFAMSTQKYCGKRLSDALGLICNGQYNSMYKKSGQEMEMADYPHAYEFSPFLSRARARGMLDGRFADRRYRRDPRGVHDECCINGCTMLELSTYCSNSPFGSQQ